MVKEKLPKIKKEVLAFLKDESGKISKQSIMTVGALVGVSAISSMLQAKEVKAGSISLTEESPGVVKAEHSHHASHSSHSSHGSHGSY